jgi:hypothetical protein
LRSLLANANVSSFFFYMCLWQTKVPRKGKVLSEWLMGFAAAKIPLERFARALFCRKLIYAWAFFLHLCVENCSILIPYILVVRATSTLPSSKGIPTKGGGTSDLTFSKGFSTRGATTRSVMKRIFPILKQR